MLTLNAGIDTIVFDFNRRSPSKREGGHYKILPDQQMELPDLASDFINDPKCGPSLRGLVILPFGSNIDEMKVIGLTNYINFYKSVLNIEIQRTYELEQVGQKFNYERREITNFKEKIVAAQKKLEDLRIKMAQPKEVVVSDAERLASLNKTLEQQIADLKSQLMAQTAKDKENGNSSNNDRSDGDESSKQLGNDGLPAL